MLKKCFFAIIGNRAEAASRVEFRGNFLPLPVGEGWDEGVLPIVNEVSFQEFFITMLDEKEGKTKVFRIS